MIVIIRKEVRMTTRTTELFSRVNFFFTNSLAWNSSRTHCKRNEGRNKTYSRVFLLFLSLFLLQSLNLYYKRPPPPQPSDSSALDVNRAASPSALATDSPLCLPCLFVCLDGDSLLSRTRGRTEEEGGGGGEKGANKVWTNKKREKKKNLNLS